MLVWTLRALRLRHVPLRTTRRCASTGSGVKPVPVLADASLEHFRGAHFLQETPAVFPAGHFAALPAIRKWFKHDEDGSAELNTYLQRHDDLTVPLEITRLADPSSAASGTEFERVEAPLSLFLDASARMAVASQWDERTGPWIYLAQCSLWSLPAALQDDVPTPAVVSSSGRGDVYDSSVWLGRAPTYTTLHRDPNPNLFVQLAGRKVVRMTDPANGSRMYHEVRSRLRAEGHGAAASASIRGEEMMVGQEKEMLKSLVWDDGDGKAKRILLEAEVGPGDGIFIPKGWWHSLMGVGRGMTGSVNWWFR